MSLDGIRFVLGSLEGARMTKPRISVDLWIDNSGQYAAEWVRALQD
jgi:hypothetical protein